MLGGADDSVRHRNSRSANRVIFGIFPQHRSLYVLFISYPGSWIITIIMQVICYLIMRKKVHSRAAAV